MGSCDVRVLTERFTSSKQRCRIGHKHFVLLDHVDRKEQLRAWLLSLRFQFATFSGTQVLDGEVRHLVDCSRARGFFPSCTTGSARTPAASVHLHRTRATHLR